MIILGISAFYHDSAVALLKDGKVVAAAQEERFTRKKHDSSFPANALRFCLQYGGVSIDELDAVVFYDKPFLKFERLLETYYSFAPKGLRSFLSAMPVWIKEKMMLKKVILDALAEVEEYDGRKIRLLFPEHHLSHAASAFFPSPYEESAILTVDGVGEWATASLSHGKGKEITILKELKFPHSLGLLYSAFTYYLGFQVNSGEYKLMGLAPYGNPDSDNLKRFLGLIRENLIDIADDGSLWLDQEYFDYAAGLRMVNEKKWENMFGFPRREPESELRQEHCDLAMAIQIVTEDVVMRMAKELKKLTGSPNLCIAGGVGLNCVANGRLLKEGSFENIWIQPAAGDAGGALGACYAGYHISLGHERKVDGKGDSMQGALLGPEFSRTDVEILARRYKAPFEHYDDFDGLCSKVADLLDEGKVVGWYQGRMEYGPRALGNRSILGDARSPEMQKKLNLKIKFRESFRPFAPSVLFEDATEYFELDEPSPYMLLVTDVAEKRRSPLPEGYHSMAIKDKLYFCRSDVPAITHLDYSARIQTVHEDINPRYHRMISSFKEKTGYGVIVNTSFNVRGEPIVCTPEDAYKCFMRTEMDCLVMVDTLFDKEKQPKWKEERDWRQDYVLD